MEPPKPPGGHSARSDRFPPSTRVTPREVEVLALIAEGRTDRGIAKELYVMPKTVEAHVRSIFRKLELPTDSTENRRVHAVLTFLRARTPSTLASMIRPPPGGDARAGCRRWRGERAGRRP
ncbi:MAG: LuxR C-terminal-related transcriptional regulator [Actinomycetota bacterium]|nr:LuxR C-terminal-related transcriptional regulator [Actinomycetota bacterium]